MEITDTVFQKIKKSIHHAMNSAFYKKHFENLSIDDLNSPDDFYNLPFTEKEDLRNSYPLGLSSVTHDEIVRIHSSSGTTGVPIVIPYTKRDVTDWTYMIKRCYETAGLNASDVIQITPGYGLWTAGIGFQLGAENLGAMAIPIGPGNTEKQIQMMIDFKSTVLTATSSYGLLLAEEIERRGIKNKICLKKGIFGSERWGAKMRSQIVSKLGIELYDIYGLTEIYGPGIGMSCTHNQGIHMWTDFFFYEIVDPETGNNVPQGTYGELVITTLRKEGAPLIRYRTHDITRELPDPCPCSLPYPVIDAISGRSDDMVKVKGVIIYPRRVEELLSDIDGISGEYQVLISHIENHDTVQLLFETPYDQEGKKYLENIVRLRFKEVLGIFSETKAVGIGELPRSEKKTQRILDNRII